MKNILLINAKKEFGHSKGEFNDTLHNCAKDFFEKNNFIIKETIVDDGYDVEEEVEKLLWADTVIYQMPGWWMTEPWILKKWMDEVFTQGHGKLYESDGRSRSDDSKLYGSGGLLNSTKYMLSLTWNAPLEAFTQKEQFFEGVGVDGLYLHFHKANQFLAMKPCETFICNDVIKVPEVETYISEYEKHLQKVFIDKN